MWYCYIVWITIWYLFDILWYNLVAMVEGQGHDFFFSGDVALRAVSAMAAAVVFDAVARQATDNIPSVLAQACTAGGMRETHEDVACFVLEQSTPFTYFSLSFYFFCMHQFEGEVHANWTVLIWPVLGRLWVKGLVLGKAALQARPPSRHQLHNLIFTSKNT